MKVTLVGRRKVEYTSKKTGEFKEGLELYCIGTRNDVDGQACDTLWIRKGTKIYEDVMKMDFSKFIKADVVNEVPLGGRYPELHDIAVLA